LKQLIIKLSGKASQVFKFFNLFCEQRGNIRIEELKEEK